MRRRVAITLIVIALAGCGRATVSDRSTVPQEPPSASVSSDSRPELTDSWPSNLSRDQLRDGLDRLMNTGDGKPADKLARLFHNDPRYPEGTRPWAEADLDGDGTSESVLALPVTNPGASDYQKGQGAALFVIYQQDGRYQVDVSDRMSDRLEVQLMGPNFHGVADLTGRGTPQILWSRPVAIATGPQPLFLFVTAWRPGSFTTLSGEMAISSTPKDRPKVAIDGSDVVMTGGGRQAMFLPPRVDRYRFVDGAFRLIDRRFIQNGEDAYSKFWDGLVAEDAGRLGDAEQAYRAAIDPGRKAHSGLVPRYHNVPTQLSESEVAGFGEALRALARFRLGALLISGGRQKEAADLLNQAPGPYEGLAKALLQAGNREAGCQAAADWAAKDPNFLPALNRGVADAPWTPQMLCSHETIDDQLP